MAEQYIHRYELLIGQPTSFYEGTPTVKNFVDTPPDIVNQSNVQNYVNTKDGDALILSSHNIDFDIDKSKESGKESKLVIYNLSDNFREYLNAKSGKPVALILKAGYATDEELPIVFQGEIFKTTDSFMGHTRKTEILLKSGYGNLQEAYTVRTFKKGTKASDVLSTVISDLKLPVGTLFLSQNEDIIIQKNITVNGKTIDFLTKFAKQYEANVFVEDGAVKVLPKNYVERDGRWVYTISARTGTMIGSPTLKTDTEATQENEAVNRTNITVTTTLNGAFSIGDYVSLESKYHNGVYEIESISHKGSYEGSQWISVLDIKPVDGWEVRL